VVHGLMPSGTTPLGTGAHGIPEDDVVLPFQIDPFALRGRVVRLGPAIDAILSRHDYPTQVATALGEMVALAAALAGSLKYAGVFSLQIKGAGPVRMMVADVTSEGQLRGYAAFDEQVRTLPEGATVPRLFGAGHLALTVDQGDDTERYQGIVALEGPTLAECIHHYFRQSEQFQAGVKVAAAHTPAAGGGHSWRAGAIMVQRLPPEDAQGSAEGRELAEPIAADAEAQEDGWRRALILMSSTTSAELVDPALPPWRLVDRLFQAEGVRIYRPHVMQHACRCSRARVEGILRALPRGEVEELKVDGAVVVTCEFCNRRHVFDDDALAELYAGAN
jgi:molecular chaperone Hsp33